MYFCIYWRIYIGIMPMKTEEYLEEHAVSAESV